MVFGIYGGPPPARLWQGTIPADSLQFSPHLPPTALNIADQPEGSIDQCLIAAPAGTIERHYVLAHALRALRPGATAIVWAANDRGGARLKKELTALGLQNITEASGDHARLIRGTCPPALSPAVAAAIAAGGLHYRADIGYWTQPGVFSWDRIDPGTVLLLRHLPALSGTGADFGCGIGILGLHGLQSPAVTTLTLIDLDQRAVAAARKNIHDPRAAFIWGDLRDPSLTLPSALDFIVMNPPFHSLGQEDIDLGRVFIARAAASLKKGGVCWLVANRHLPYEAMLQTAFTTLQTHAQQDGFKIIAATT